MNAPAWLTNRADSILAAITTLLAAGHLGHLFSQEWVVLLSAIFTFAASFLPRTPEAPAAPAKT